MAKVGNIKGLTGSQGPAGPQGPAGVTGASGPPSGACSPDGQIYIDLDTGDTYVCQGGAWVLTTDQDGNPILQGPPGPQGPQGIQGIQGIQGVQGVAGLDGQDGNVWFEDDGPPPDGVVVPLFGTEIEGDLYLDLLNGDVYRFEGGSWF